MHDRRECSRSTKNINIRLYQDEDLTSFSKTLNFNASGMFIQADALLFPKGTLLNIIIDDPVTLKRHSKTAKIVHRSLKGIGVQFQEPATDMVDEESNLHFMQLLESQFERDLAAS